VLRFLLGLIVGALLGAGGILTWQHFKPQPEPQVLTAPSIAAPEAPPAKKARKRGGGGGGGGVTATEAGAAEELPTLTAADVEQDAEGDVLQPRERKMDLTTEDPRELTQGEIDGAFAKRATGIIACITAARGDWPVTGRVNAGVLVAADGSVAKSRVEAPAYMLKRGLGRCARKELARLSFPAVGRETVVTVPFDIE
jgi:hypothetical protein